MPTVVQIRRGTTAENNNFIGQSGELTVDTSTWSLRVHDSLTPGGHAITGGVTGILSKAQGGTGTANPVIANTAPISVTGTWPNVTVGITGTVSVANGGTGTANPVITSNAPISVTGTWPNVTVGLSGTVGFANGGTGISTTPGQNQVLLGDGSKYNLTTLRAGTGINFDQVSPGVLTINGVRTQRVNNATTSPPQVNQVNVTTAPAGTFNTGSITTAFQGDMSNVTFAIAQSISGASTLGPPTTGYTLNPQVSSSYNYMYNSSGYNYSTSGNAGRTLASLHYDKVDNYGQGDATAFYARAYVNSSKAGATSWLASPAACLYIGQCDAGANGVYLNPIEIDCNDNGYDAAAISFVSNLNRTNNTAALGQPWIGFRSQSYGSKAVDAFLSATGLFNIGLDLTTATLGSSNAAITLKQGQFLYFGSTNSDATNNLPNYTNPNGAYIVESGNILSIQNASTAHQIGTNGQYFFIGGVGEAMRIDSSGNLLVGTTASTGGNNKVAIHFDKNAVNGLSFRQLVSDAGGGQPVLFNNVAGTGIGSITAGASSVAYNTSSDYRLKENVAPITTGLATVSALKPVTYDWKFDGSQGDGFIAHELAEVIPHAVAGEKDAVNKDGSIKPQGVDYSKIVVHLVAAIQELSAKNDALETRLVALEAK